MKRLIITIRITVGDMDRAKAIKETLEALAGNLLEETTVNTRYDELPAQS